ncbi:hypothetical protein BOTNAR_0054g00170 [Botryotinia narcissicola]|uniref:Uncharacterized protein n=1 Tax=Botryotinia narcissicola TaxID=278944 RepID=A0A4Z1IZH5_9HELO|nr:hypothetical protein BOTNAR_0054g00170 [Botryotinia narcissicola]
MHLTVKLDLGTDAEMKRSIDVKGGQNAKVAAGAKGAQEGESKSLGAPSPSFRPTSTSTPTKSNMEASELFLFAKDPLPKTLLVNLLLF